MITTGKVITLGACLSLFSIGATAAVTGIVEDVEASGNGYVDSMGTVLKSGLDECVYDGMYTEDSAINVCEGIEEEVVVEEVIEPAPVAVAPEPKGRIDIRQFNEETLFAFDSAALTVAGDEAMAIMLDTLSQFQEISAISVVGHTDSTGTEEYNLNLSEQRAQTVASVIANRYPNAVIDVIGMGETAPIATNDTAEGRQLNRRVEVQITASRTIFN